SRMVCRVRTALGREITATAEHPLLTVDGWRALGALRIGDPIAATRECVTDADVSCDLITIIEQIGERETFDLQIENDHYFIATGRLAHNSHVVSFAMLAYASAFLKTHPPAAFYAALLNNQPMGFYPPATIVRDAQRHGQVIHPAAVNFSEWLCVIEPDG